MRRILSSVLLLTGALLPVAATGCEDRPAPPSYSGPAVGTLARDALRSLAGQRFRDHDQVFGGGEWTVGELVLGPHPDDPSRKGPHVLLRQEQRTVVLPMESDGDAADLYRRVRGSPHDRLSTRTSEAYRAALARAARS